MTIAILATLLGAVVVVLVTFLMRGTPVRGVRGMDSSMEAPGERTREGAPDAKLDGVAPFGVRDGEFCEFVPLFARTSLAPGHRVTVFTNGDVFDALLEAVASARKLVTWHVFWFKPGRLADRTAEVLLERAAAGVRVLMLLDSFGSSGIGDDYLERLRRGGVEVCRIRPVRWHTLYKVQQRIHVRSVVIDGIIGFTGGFGIDDRWLGHGCAPGEWRDTSVRVEGRSVGQLQGAFVANWAEATGELVLGDYLFGPESGSRRPAAERGGERAHERSGDPAGTTVDDAVAGLLYSAPSLGSTGAERVLSATVACARERLWITTAYFVPDRNLRKLLAEAAERGVDVRVLTPGGNSDRRLTWYASRAHECEMLDAGVKIYEYRPTMVHAKTLVVDGTWSMIGTVNVDNRSMVLNDEVALLIWDRKVGRRMEEFFEDDLRHAERVTPDRSRSRSRGRARLAEQFAARVSRIL